MGKGMDDSDHGSVASTSTTASRIVLPTSCQERWCCTFTPNSEIMQYW